MTRFIKLFPYSILFALGFATLLNLSAIQQVLGIDLDFNGVESFVGNKSPKNENLGDLESKIFDIEKGMEPKNLKFEESLLKDAKSQTTTQSSKGPDDDDTLLTHKTMKIESMTVTDPSLYVKDVNNLSSKLSTEIIKKEVTPFIPITSRSTRNSNLIKKRRRVKKILLTELHANPPNELVRKLRLLPPSLFVNPNWVPVTSTTPKNERVSNTPIKETILIPSDPVSEESEPNVIENKIEKLEFEPIQGMNKLPVFYEKYSKHLKSEAAKDVSPMKGLFDFPIGNTKPNNENNPLDEILREAKIMFDNKFKTFHPDTINPQTPLSSGSLGNFPNLLSNVKTLYESFPPKDVRIDNRQLPLFPSLSAMIPEEFARPNLKGDQPTRPMKELIFLRSQPEPFVRERLVDDVKISNPGNLNNPDLDVFRSLANIIPKLPKFVIRKDAETNPEATMSSQIHNIIQALATQLGLNAENVLELSKYSWPIQKSDSTNKFPMGLPFSLRSTAEDDFQKRNNDELIRSSVRALMDMLDVNGPSAKPLHYSPVMERVNEAYQETPIQSPMPENPIYTKYINKELNEGGPVVVRYNKHKRRNGNSWSKKKILVRLLKQALRELMDMEPEEPQPELTDNFAPGWPEEHLNHYPDESFKHRPIQRFYPQNFKPTPKYVPHRLRKEYPFQEIENRQHHSSYYVKPTGNSPYAVVDDVSKEGVANYFETKKETFRNRRSENNYGRVLPPFYVNYR